MALSVSQTDALARHLKHGMRVAAMGYPDTIAPLGMIEAMLGERYADLSWRWDSEAICKRHGMKARDIPDAESFFSLMGADLTVFDVVQERGCEVLCDLNYPMQRAEEFDIVLDVGTVEHCFNIAQAIRNMAGLVKAGGLIVHENPFNCGNHGFYSLNPTFFEDFYTANGFEILECRLSLRDGRGAETPRGKRFKFTNEEANVFCVARRTAVRPFVYPVQAKYANLIPAAGVAGEKGD